LSDPTIKGTKETAVKTRPAAIGKIIREFRNSLGLTQVQFASETGITPTSVYRYEAETNIPNNDILARILQFAVKKQALKAVQNLADVLAGRSAVFFIDGMDETSDTAPLLAAIRRLGLEQQVVIMAAVSMLQESSDKTALRIFTNLVEPWVSKAQEDFGPVSFTSGSSLGKGTVLKRPRKDAS
jgi:transcriptional regulator with XRE-family HTH domain